MAHINHNSGIIALTSEVGFSLVKYFELTATGVAQTLTISPPAKRLIIRNADDTNNLFICIDGQEASTVVGPIPGSNIKIGPAGIFTMDFDSLSSLSMISDGAAVAEGILGFKGIDP